MTKTKIIIVAAIALLVGFLLGVYGASLSQRGSIGATSYDVNHFVGDVRQGLSDALMMQSGVLVGPITTASANRVIVNTASSTVFKNNIGFVASTTGIFFRGAASLCFFLTMNATGGIVTSTVTCPATSGMFP